MAMHWVSFHTHTSFSYGDGFGTVADHVRRVAGLGMTAVGVSEHGNLNSHAAFEKECLRNGLHFIPGIEAYFGPVGEKATRRKTHLGIYAMNEVGYRNLNKIVTQSYIDFYQWPTVSWESLKENNEGLAILSGCSDSFISCRLLGGKFLGETRENFTDQQYRDTCRAVETFATVFENRYFLEVQRFPHLSRTCVLNQAFARIGSEVGVPLFATADVHYPEKAHNKIQAALHAARWASTAADFVSGDSWELHANLSYPESDAEILSDLMATGLTEEQAWQAIENTAGLAQRCTAKLPKAEALVYPQSKADWEPW